MDFDDYVAARYGRLIEHAVLLGCAEGEAGTHVDRVLLEQRKRIRRAEDPDPLVHEALERALAPQQRRRGIGSPFLALGLVLVVVAVGVALNYRPTREPMPSLFGLSGEQAEKRLEQAGYDVVLRPARACEPLGLVLGSEPRPGELVQEGATVTVRTAAPSGTFCDAYYAARSDAWEFVSFALGEGPAPEFARTVYVVVNGSDPTPIDHVAAVDRSRWSGLLDLVEEGAHTAAATDSGLPKLLVRSAPPPASWCGVRRPPETGRRVALRLEIDPRADGDDQGCPLTVDLYRGPDQEIDGVVVYTAKELARDAADTGDPAARQ